MTVTPARRSRPVASLAALLGTLLLAVLAPAALHGQDFPKLTGRVNDAAGIIPADVEARLTQKLAALETQSRRQLVIATLPSLQGYEISDYGYRLGREWGIGDEKRNDGALLIVAPNERKVRIEVGYGLEPVLTDGLSWQIVNNRIVPRFKEGDMPGGIEAGADAIITQLTLPPAEAQRIAAQADQPPEGLPIGVIIFVVFVLFFFVIPIVRSAMRGGVAVAPGTRTWTSGGGGFSSGGFSGGGGGFSGGFSGGGGSFGGGGSSGSW